MYSNKRIHKLQLKHLTTHQKAFVLWAWVVFYSRSWRTLNVVV